MVKSNTTLPVDYLLMYVISLLLIVILAAGQT